MKATSYRITPHPNGLSSTILLSHPTFPTLSTPILSLKPLHRHAPSHPCHPTILPIRNLWPNISPLKTTSATSPSLSAPPPAILDHTSSTIWPNPNQTLIRDHLISPRPYAAPRLPAGRKVSPPNTFLVFGGSMYLLPNGRLKTPPSYVVAPKILHISELFYKRPYAEVSKDSPTLLHGHILRHIKGQEIVLREHMHAALRYRFRIRTRHTLALTVRCTSCRQGFRQDHRSPRRHHLRCLMGTNVPRSSLTLP